MWQVEKTEEYLQTKFIKKSGEKRTFMSPIRNTPEDTAVAEFKNAIDNGADLRSGQVEQTIVTFEVLAHPTPGVHNEHNQLDEVIVGVRNNSSVEFIGLKFRIKGEDERGRRIEQYFFRDDMPASFHGTIISAPSWPIEDGPRRIVNKDTRPLIEELARQRPNLRTSLSRCAQQLE